MLVGFVFADESDSKKRPALIVSSPAYNRGRREIVVAAITSNVNRRLFSDHPIREWRSAGLLFPSLVTGIIRTIKQKMIERRLGALARADLDAVDRELRRSLAL